MTISNRPEPVVLAGTVNVVSLIPPASSRHFAKNNSFICNGKTLLSIHIMEICILRQPFHFKNNFLKPRLYRRSFAVHLAEHVNMVKDCQSKSIIQETVSIDEPHPLLINWSEEEDDLIPQTNESHYRSMNHIKNTSCVNPQRYHFWSLTTINIETCAKRDHTHNDSTNYY